MPASGDCGWGIFPTCMRDKSRRLFRQDFVKRSGTGSSDIEKRCGKQDERIIGRKAGCLKNSEKSIP